MKFTHFRNLLVAGSMSGLFGSLYYCGKQPAPASDVKPAAITQAAQPEQKSEQKADQKSEQKQEAPAAQAERGPESAAPKVATVAGAHATFPMRPLDEEIIKLFEQTPSGDKIKDATPNRPYKVNLYAEGGKYVRAKVDLNRNNKWDEKWSIDEKGGERIYKRQVSPSDDDTTYPDKFKLRHKQWEKTEP